MANPTTNYSFAMPTNTDLVKDLPADFEVFGQAVDTQMKTNADAAIAKSLVTTKGDLIAATGASTPARLGVGANDTVLMADSTAATGIKWGTVSSGGMTLIATTTLSGTSTTISSIPTTYKHLYIFCSNLASSSSVGAFTIATSNVSDWTRVYNAIGNATIIDGSQGSSGSPAAFGQLSPNGSNYYEISIPRYSATTGQLYIDCEGFINTNTDRRFVQGRGYGDRSAAMTSITFACGGQTISGTVYTYGVS